jgi:SPX domain protein involved in polyphosphate accumulation
MKFGQNLNRYQVVEWTPFYVDYQRLKRLYKTATEQAVERGEDVDFTGLLFGIFSCFDLTVVQISQLSWGTT